MLKLYISNKIEQLSLQFSRNIKADNNVFSSEVVVMQTSGIERWLALESAEHNGIFTNFNFIKPNSFVNQLYKLANIEADSLYNTENLKWIIFKILGDDDFKKQFETVAQYYADDEVKRLQLSVKTADLFDQYLLYRQDYIEAWNKGKLAKVTKQKDDSEAQVKGKQEQLDKHQKWQFYIWQKIKETSLESDSEESIPSKNLDKVQLRDILIEKLKEKVFQELIKAKYGKISLFGLSVITDYHIEIFHRLSELMNVNLYFLNPAPETYWYDIVSQRFVFYIEKKTGKKIEELKLHLGNELLSNYSALAKDTYNILFKNDDFVNAIDDSLVQEPKKDSLLEKIQNDIFNNLNQDQNPVTIENLKDDSIIISSSYTPMREVEALYNQLLSFLEADSSIGAKDIIVQLSDVDLYTPYIRAVFDNSPHYLPYTIADRSYIGGDTLVGVLEIILSMTSEDFTSEKVMQILNSKYIKDRFGISNTEIIRTVVRDANICFGVKGRAEDDTRFVSWVYGLERMLLGYAIKGEEAFQLEDYVTYPLDTIEGSDVEELFRFKAFVDQLIETLNKRTHDRSLTEWKAYIETLISRLFEIDKNSEAEIRYIQQQLLSIEKMNDWLNEPISYEIFQKSFTDALFSNPRAGNFITGGITFCSMIPMRSIPFKIIAMLGLNGDKFPRTDHKIAFNLIEIEYKRGDRNTKNNDKYLLLETLLSARKHLVLSYIGNSPKDNTTLPPSLLIEELIAYVKKACKDLPKKQTVENYLIQNHPLHAFSKKYFDQSSPLFTYSSDIQELTERKESHLDTDQININQVSVQELIYFFQDPFKYYYNKTLQIYYQDESNILPENEIFDLDTLQNWKIKNDLLRQDKSSKAEIEKAKIYGQLPLANMGEMILNHTEHEIETLKETYKDISKHEEISQTRIDLKFDTIRLTGSIQDIFDQKLISANVSKEASQAKYLLIAWIKHLCLIANKETIDSQFLSTKYNPPLIWKYDMIPNDEALAILKKLIAVFIKGQKEIIAFDPLIGFNLAKGLIGKSEEKHKDLLDTAYKNLKKLDDPKPNHGVIKPYIIKESELGFFENKASIIEDLREVSLLIYGTLHQKKRV